jgi:hypothetical protein
MSRGCKGRASRCIVLAQTAVIATMADGNETRHCLRQRRHRRCCHTAQPILQKSQDRIPKGQGCHEGGIQKPENLRIIVIRRRTPILIKAERV